MNGWVGVLNDGFVCMVCCAVLFWGWWIQELKKGSIWQ